MRGARLILLAFCLGASLALSGCGGLDYMIEEYNSRFSIHDDTRRLVPGDIGYDEKDMIEPEYHVYTENSLNIPAPQVEGATYRWQLFKKVDGETGESVMELELTQEEKTAQTLIIYLPERVKIGTYQLRLTVTVEGRTYVDTALVSVHAEVVGQ